MLLDQDRQSLITVRGGYKSKARGGGGGGGRGSEVSLVPNIVNVKKRVFFICSVTMFNIILFYACHIRQITCNFST